MSGDKVPGKSVHMLREMSKGELEDLLKETQMRRLKELGEHHQNVHAIGPNNLRKDKKTIAKIKTILAEKSYRK